MTQVLAIAAGVLAASVLLLTLSILVVRLLGDRRRGRERALRPAIQDGIADYLSAEDPVAPPPPESAEQRRLWRLVALEALTELRGSERERLTALVEEMGIVDETAAELFARRGRTRRSAAEALARYRSRRPVEALIRGLEDPDLDVRLSCAGALAELGDTEHVPAILSTTDETATERPGAAAAVLITLGRSNPAAVGAALAPSRLRELRRLAAAVIGELRLAEHAPLLRLALGSEDDELAARAARGLGMIGDADAVEDLLALLADRDRAWYVRLAATSGLGAIGDPSAAEALETELYEGNWSLRSKAAESLRLLGDRGEGALRRALASPLTEVRVHARVALES